MTQELAIDDVLASFERSQSLFDEARDSLTRIGSLSAVTGATGERLTAASERLDQVSADVQAAVGALETLAETGAGLLAEVAETSRASQHGQLVESLCAVQAVLETLPGLSAATEDVRQQVAAVPAVAGQVREVQAGLTLLPQLDGRVADVERRVAELGRRVEPLAASVTELMSLTRKVTTEFGTTKTAMDLHRRDQKRAELAHATQLEELEADLRELRAERRADAAVLEQVLAAVTQLVRQVESGPKPEALEQQLKGVIDVLPGRQRRRLGV